MKQQRPLVKINHYRGGVQLRGGFRPQAQPPSVAHTGMFDPKNGWGEPDRKSSFVGAGHYVSVSPQEVQR